MTLAANKTKDIYVKDEKMNNWIYSIWATTNFYQIDYETLAKRLRYLNKERFIIYDIIPFTKESNISEFICDYISYLPISKDNPYYIKITMNISDFFKNENFEFLTNKNIKHFENDNVISNTVFIFNYLPLPFIIAAFKLQNIIISPGSNRKRGILSPVHLRLAQFNTCLEGIENNTIYDSYHNYNKLAIQPLFDQTILDKIQSFKNITEFYKALEQYYKIKLNIPDNINEFDWNLRKDNPNIIFNLEEFIQFYKSNNILNKDSNNNDNNNI